MDENNKILAKVTDGPSTNLYALGMEETVQENLSNYYGEFRKGFVAQRFHHAPKSRVSHVRMRTGRNQQRTRKLNRDDVSQNSPKRSRSPAIRKDPWRRRPTRAESFSLAERGAIVCSLIRPRRPKGEIFRRWEDAEGGETFSATKEDRCGSPGKPAKHISTKWII